MSRAHNVITLHAKCITVPCSCEMPRHREIMLIYSACILGVAARRGGSRVIRYVLSLSRMRNQTISYFHAQSRDAPFQKRDYYLLQLHFFPINFKIFKYIHTNMILLYYIDLYYILYQYKNCTRRQTCDYEFEDKNVGKKIYVKVSKILNLRKRVHKSFINFYAREKNCKVSTYIRFIKTKRIQFVKSHNDVKNIYLNIKYEKICQFRIFGLQLRMQKYVANYIIMINKIRGMQGIRNYQFDTHNLLLSLEKE